MLNEIGEFKAYTDKPVYRSTGKRDTSWLGRFTFNTFLDFEGLGRILTIIARGYLFRDGVDPHENIEHARNALCTWCSIPEKRKKAPESGTAPKVNFGHLSTDFPELVDEKGNGWFHRHVKNVIKFARKNPDLVSKPAQKNCEKLAAGFTREWKKKVKQLQVPSFAPNTKAAWGLRFDDILADSLELGPLHNYEISLSQEVIDWLKEATPKGVPEDLLPMLTMYCLAHRQDGDEWVILPVSAVDVTMETQSSVRNGKGHCRKKSWNIRKAMAFASSK